MSDQYLIFDLWRLLVTTCALWLGALVLKLCWDRFRDPDSGRTHPLTYLSYAVALFAIAGYRIAALGEPPEPRLAITTTIVVLGLIGVLKRVRLPWKPPHLRD